MKLSVINKIALAAIGGVALMCMPSCSDDHFDWKWSSESNGKTIWENVQANAQLDSLAQILSQTKYYTSDTDTKRSMTYADLLNGSQSFTLFAPVNGSYNAKAYLDQLATIKQLQSSGSAEDLELGNNLEYNLGREFLQNHIIRGLQESNTDDQNDSLVLLNGKLGNYYVSARTFGSNSAKLIDDVASSNGMLHTLDAKADYLPNIYEYVLSNEDDYQSAYAAYTDTTKTFNENGSTQGAMNGQGQMVYIDSVYNITYNYLKDSRASVQDEDSFYIAVIPMNQAYNEGQAKLEGLFKYKYTDSNGQVRSSYKGNYSGTTDQFGATTFKVSNPDSLTDAQVKKSMIASMFFSPSIFPNNETYKPYRRNVNAILSYAQNADSLISTNGTIYYKNEETGKYDLFDGLTPENASNGVVYPLQSYTLPISAIIKDKTLDLRYSWSGDVQGSGNSGTGSNNLGGELITLVNNSTEWVTDTIWNEDHTEYTLEEKEVELEDGNYNKAVDISALGTSRTYRYFELGSSARMNIYIPLPGLYSTKYRVRIQVLPSDVNTEKIWKDRKGNVYEPGQRIKFTARIQDDEGNTIGTNEQKSVENYVEPGAVSTITLWDEIEIPKCYVNLPDEITKSYPLLVLTVTSSGQGRPSGTNATNKIGLSMTKVFIDPVE